MYISITRNPKGWQKKYQEFRILEKLSLFILLSRRVFLSTQKLGILSFITIRNFTVQIRANIKYEYIGSKFLIL